MCLYAGRPHPHISVCTWRMLAACGCGAEGACLLTMHTSPPCHPSPPAHADACFVSADGSAHGGRWSFANEGSASGGSQYGRTMSGASGGGDGSVHGRMSNAGSVNDGSVHGGNARTMSAQQGGGFGADGFGGKESHTREASDALAEVAFFTGEAFVDGATWHARCTGLTCAWDDGTQVHAWPGDTVRCPSLPNILALHPACLEGVCCVCVC